MNHRAPKKQSKGRIRALLAAGGLLVIGGLATAAAFTDFANLNLGNGGVIGSGDRFDIAVVLPSNVVEEADTDAGYNWAISGSDTLVPGGQIVTTIPIFNNSSKTKANTSFALELIGDGSVGSAPNIVKFLRFTGEVDGTVVFTNVTWDNAKGSLGTLAARGKTALANGATYVVGDNGSEKKVKLTIKYLDEPDTVNYNGGLAAIRLKVSSSSTS